MKVGVIGSGAYALALADICAKKGCEVTLWCYSRDSKDLMAVMRKTPKLPNYIINSKIFITDKAEKTVEGKDLIIITVPSTNFESTMKIFGKIMPLKTPVIIGTKGIQENTGYVCHQIFEKYSKNKYGIISGPTFATDIVSDASIGFALATKYSAIENATKKCLESNRVKFRRTKDVIGVEICGSIKNVLAIGAGILEGMGATDSTKAMFLTESLNDVKELIDKLGGNKKTILSYAGFGDIMMTCSSKTSRNFSFGYLIGKGGSAREIEFYQLNNTVEGVHTAKTITKLVKSKKIKMPILNLINSIIDGKTSKEELLKFLIKK